MNNFMKNLQTAAEEVKHPHDTKGQGQYKKRNSNATYH